MIDCETTGIGCQGSPPPPPPFAIWGQTVARCSINRCHFFKNLYSQMFAPPHPQKENRASQDFMEKIFLGLWVCVGFPLFPILLCFKRNVLHTMGKSSNMIFNIFWRTQQVTDVILQTCILRWVTLTSSGQLFSTRNCQMLLLVVTTFLRNNYFVNTVHTGIWLRHLVDEVLVLHEEFRGTEWSSDTSQSNETLVASRRSGRRVPSFFFSTGGQTFSYPYHVNY